MRLLAAVAVTLSVSMLLFVSAPAYAQNDRAAVERVATKFLNAGIAGDGKKLCSLFSYWTLRANYPTLASCVKTYQGNPWPYRSAAVTKVVFQWNRTVAKVSLTITQSDGTTAGGGMTLIKENGVYKVRF